MRRKREKCSRQREEQGRRPGLPRECDPPKEWSGSRQGWILGCKLGSWGGGEAAGARWCWVLEAMVKR